MVASSVTVVFDGTCGFCTRSVRYLHRLDRAGRVTSIACQVVQRQEAGYSLAGVDCGESAWALTSDGDKASGAQAAMLICSVLMQRRWPVAAGRLPGIRHALTWGYRTVARNRYRLPGDARWCSAHEGACGST